MACRRQFAVDGRRPTHIDHSHGGKVIQHGAWCQARSERPQPLTQRGVQPEGQEGNEAMRLDPDFALVIVRASSSTNLPGVMAGGFCISRYTLRWFPRAADLGLEDLPRTV